MTGGTANGSIDFFRLIRYIGFLHFSPIYIVDIMFFFQKRFGNHRENSKRSRSPQPRRLRFEPLECREMLTVSSAEFNWIRTQYSDLNLSANMADYNVIEITTAELDDFSIRSAISEAGNTSQNDLIVVRTTETQNRIILAGAELAININASQRGSVTIVSLGTDPLIIDANQNSRVMGIGAGSAVALAGLTIIGGNNNNYGGGIFKLNGMLTVTNSTISGNSGNGIYNGEGTMTVMNCTVSNNSRSGISNANGTVMVTNSTISGNLSGGINNSAGVILTNCTISDNSTTGGIYNYSGTVTVMGSTISGNSATNGGGISNTNGTVTVTNSTISVNTADNGGGIYNYRTLAGAESITITNSTIAGNSTGIYTSSGTMTINNTIVAGNISGDVFRNAGTLTGNNNLIGNGTGQTSFLDGVNGSFVGRDPLFVDPANGNYRLAAGSPAIDKGRNALAVDASGKPLLWDKDGHPRIVNGVVDMGAYEYHGTGAPPTLDINGDGSVTPADANLLLRYLYGYSGEGLIQYLVTPGTGRDTTTEITAYLEANLSVFDIDGDGNVNPADANLLLRYLFGYSGDGLTQYLVTGNSTRKTATEITAYIESVLPSDVPMTGVMVSSTVCTAREQVVAPVLTGTFETPEFPLSDVKNSYRERERPVQITPVQVAYAPDCCFPADHTEIMRQRQMLDLDRSRFSGQKFDDATFIDWVWSEEKLFGDEWIDFSEQKTSDFWSEVFEDDLDTRAILRLRL